MTNELSILLDEFIQVGSLSAKLAHVRRNVRVVERFLEAQGISEPAEITVAAIEAFLSGERKRGKKPKTIHSYCGAISVFLDFLKKRRLVEHNVARDVSLPRIPKQAPRFLTESEIAIALQVARENGIFGEVALAIYTGMRMSELRVLKWADVDTARKQILVRESKSGRPRRQD